MDPLLAADVLRFFVLSQIPGLTDDFKKAHNLVFGVLAHSKIKDRPNLQMTENLDL